MAGRTRLGRRGSRVVVVLATAGYVTGLGIALAPPGNSFGGSCNGSLSSPGLDASHERGPVIINGNPGPRGDVIIGSKGDDTINGNGGTDLICGGAGADDINGGDDSDRVFGESGDDTIRGGGDDDFLSGGAGNDDINSGAGADNLMGDGGDDILNGTEGDPGTSLDGGSGHNLCFVGPGQDVDNCSF